MHVVLPQHDARARERRDVRRRRRLSRWRARGEANIVEAEVVLQHEDEVWLAGWRRRRGDRQAEAWNSIPRVGELLHLRARRGRRRTTTGGQHHARRTLRTQPRPRSSRAHTARPRQWLPNPSCDGRVVTSAVRHFKICRQKKADLMVRHVPRSRAQETALHSTRCAARLGIHPQPHPTPRRAAVASGERALVLLSVGVLPCVFG